MIQQLQAQIGQLSQQVDAQERIILSQRAQLAEERTRVANLQRMNDHNQRMIGLLKAQLKKATQTEAEKVFGGGS